MHSQFLQTIVENPLDDAPRLIYADWLDDQGDYERAEFIRVQIELASTPEWIPATPAEVGLGPDEVHGELRKANRRYGSLKLRELELLKRNSVFGTGGLMWLDVARWPIIHWDGNWEFRRGFVEKVKFSHDGFLAFSVAELFKRAPILEVGLVDRNPLYGWGENQIDRWGWDCFGDFGDYPHFIEETLLNRMPNNSHSSMGDGSRLFATVQEATTALSKACVVYGRQLAGLPSI